MSRLTYNTHVWSVISEDAVCTWANGIRAMLYPMVRPLLRGLPPFQFGVETLAGLAGLLSPRDTLHVVRLRYFQRWIRRVPPVLWNLLWLQRRLPLRGCLLCDSPSRGLLPFMVQDVDLRRTPS